MIAELETEYTERSINIKLDKIEYQGQRENWKTLPLKAKLTEQFVQLAIPIS